MNAREKWLTAGLVALALLLGWTALWQQARHQDAREAVRRYVELNEREEKEDAEQLALIRAARPEIRRSLTRGEFETALKRLKSLEAEDDEAGGVPKSGKGLAIDTLWPPKSAERKRLEAVLQELVKKQREGYDVAPAQQQLAAVAEAARGGKRQEALDAFNRAAELIANAALRPGFKAPVPPAAQTAAGGGLSPEELRKIEQQIRGIQAFRQQLPQMMAQVEGEQRAALEQAQTLFDEMVTAHRQKRDIRPVMALLAPIQKEFAEARESNNWAQVEKRLAAARALVKTLPALPEAAPGAAGGAGTPPAPAAPGAQPPTAAAPGPGGPAGKPAAPAGAAAPAAEGVLRALDMIRAMPDAEYQTRKPMIVAMLAQAARQGGLFPRPGGPGGAPNAPEQPERNGALGGLPVLRRTLEVSAGLPNLSLQLEGKPELPLHAAWVMGKAGGELHVKGPEGSVTATIETGEKDARVKIRTERAQEGPSGQLEVAIPMAVGGWYWIGPGGPEVIAVDREYQVKLTGEKLPKLVLRGAAGDLEVEAGTASAAGYRGSRSVLWVRLPLGRNAGVIEHTIHLVGTRRAQP